MDPSRDSLDVTVITPQELIFQGAAETVVLPGEQGYFEVAQNHKPLLSRLIRGDITIDGRVVTIKRGVVKVAFNRILSIVEIETGMGGSPL